MKYTCKHVRSRLLDLVEGNTSGDVRRRLMEHVDGCEACAAELEDLRTAWGRMPEAAPVQPSSAVRDRVLALGWWPQPAHDVRPSPSRVHRWATGIAVAVAVAAVGVGVGVRSPSGTEGGVTGVVGGSLLRQGTDLGLGRPFPSFAGVDIESGETVSIQDLQGKVVLLNIWATWCKPCESEMPSLERLYRELGADGLAVVAVSVDQESTFKVRRWIEERGLTFMVLHDRGGMIERTLRTRGVPESFVIDRSGVLVHRETGPRVWDSPDFGGMIRRLVSDGA